jgi:hypothetical protein
MIGWLGGNAWLLSVIATGAGLFWSCAWGLSLAGIRPDSHPLLWLLSCAVAICGAYCYSKLTLTWIARLAR